MLNFELHRSVHCWNEINVLHIYVTWHKQKWNISSVLVCSTFSMFWTTSTWLGSAWRQSSIDVRKVRVQFMDLPRSEDNCIIVPTIALQYNKKMKCHHCRLEVGEKHSQGKFFPGWRAEGGGGWKRKFILPFRNAPTTPPLSEIHKTPILNF